MRKFTQWEKGWLSALLDTDGGVYFNRNCGKRAFVTCRMQIDNTSKLLITKIKKAIGEGSVHEYRTKRTPGCLGATAKKMYRFQASANTLRWVLPQLTSLAKKKQREIILEALPILKLGRWKTRCQTKKVHRLYLKMKEINSCGSNFSKSFDLSHKYLIPKTARSNEAETRKERRKKK